jgi:hypothetical protein
MNQVALGLKAAAFRNGTRCAMRYALECLVQRRVPLIGKPVERVVGIGGDLAGNSQIVFDRTELRQFVLDQTVPHQVTWDLRRGDDTLVVLHLRDFIVAWR